MSIGPVLDASRSPSTTPSRSDAHAVAVAGSDGCASDSGPATTSSPIDAASSHASP